MPFPKPFGSMDGATHLTQFAIAQTEKLAAAIESYEYKKIPVPEHLTAGINQLSTHLQTFQPGYDIPLVFNTGDDPKEIMHNNLELAWYLSANVYFHNRLLNIFDNDLRPTVEDILECLHRAEEIKMKLQPDLLCRDLPVTFPAFVASCNAIDRRPWKYFWRSMQQYDCPNISAQWGVVKEIWEFLDDFRAVGAKNLSWVDLMQVSETMPFRLSDLHESVGV